LAEAKLSDCEDGRYTRTWRIAGRVRRVLKLNCPAVESLLGEEFPEPWRPSPTPATEDFP
jgi:hypothetical protein